MAIAMHPTQLRICHEKIAAEARIWASRCNDWAPDRPIEAVMETQWCSLRDVVWCYDCGRYVCRIHATSRHDQHRTVAD